MITSLRIRNYALIDTLDIEFASGFSVITGETGAGKSIVLGALGLLLGQRADAKAIKVGATKCVVEAVFNIEGLDVAAFFSHNDIDYDRKECLLRREVTAAGKSRAFINDTPVALSQLKELVPQLIDIHSQHQNLLLGQEYFVLETLDALAHNATERSDYAQAYVTWHAEHKKLVALRAQAEKEKEDTDYLRFQLSQLEEANLEPEEQEALEQEQDRLAHAEEIKTALYAANAYLSKEELQPAQELKNMARTLHKVASVFPLAGELAGRLESVAIELADLGSELEEAVSSVEFDPDRMAYVDERLGTLYTLQKRHKVESVAALIDLMEQLSTQLDEIENIDTYLEKQVSLVAACEQKLHAKGATLTATRVAAAEQLSAALQERLQPLGMPSVQIAIHLVAREQADLSGMDTAQFLFSANKNVPLREVSSIASGGEIARLMLSLKTIVAGSKQLPTIVFDEIDTGVSGTMAEKMALLMQEMAKSCQVLCITHLPQIAALGAQHYRVFKEEGETGTTTHIIRLTDEERIREIANMLSGEQLTDAAINNAKSLLHL